LCVVSSKGKMMGKGMKIFAGTYIPFQVRSINLRGNLPKCDGVQNKKKNKRQEKEGKLHGHVQNSLLAWEGGEIRNHFNSNACVWMLNNKKKMFLGKNNNIWGFGCFGPQRGTSEAMLNTHEFLIVPTNPDHELCRHFQSPNQNWTEDHESWFGEANDEDGRSCKAWLVTNKDEGDVNRRGVIAVQSRRNDHLRHFCTNQTSLAWGFLGGRGDGGGTGGTRTPRLPGQINPNTNKRPRTRRCWFEKTSNFIEKFKLEAHLKKKSMKKLKINLLNIWVKNENLLIKSADVWF